MRRNCSFVLFQFAPGSSSVACRPTRFPTRYRQPRGDESQSAVGPDQRVRNGRLAHLASSDCSAISQLVAVSLAEARQFATSRSTRKRLTDLALHSTETTCHQPGEISSAARRDV